MATTTTTAGAASVVSPFVPVGGLGVANYTYAVATAPIINDVFEMVRLPRNAKIVDVLLTSTDMDTSTGLTLSVGYGGSTAYFISASTIGQTGGVARMAAATAGAALTLTAEDTVDVLVAAAPTTFAAGSLTLTVTYVMVY